MDLSTIFGLFPGFAPAIPYVTAAVAAASALATALPPPKAGGAYASVYAVVNWIALNFGHAKNASAPTSGAAVPPK